MIYDRIKNWKLYTALGENIERGLRMIAEADFSKLTDGKRILGDEDVYMNLFSYETRPHDKRKLESHKKYVDIQYIVSGEEMVAFAESENCEPTDANIEADAYFHASDIITLSPLNEGYFMIIFPHEIHGPNLETQAQGTVRKAVIKARI